MFVLDWILLFRMPQVVYTVRWVKPNQVQNLSALVASSTCNEHFGFSCEKKGLKIFFIKFFCSSIVFPLFFRPIETKFYGHHRNVRKQAAAMV